MSQYKIPQNVEAEDKLLGPFTFKQFIYLIVTAVGILVAYLLAKISPWLITIPLPFILVFAILGIYHREDQPVETYLLAALNFLFKPHRRIWDNEGYYESVKMIIPKKAELPPTKSLATERGQLAQLAQVMDTRGWNLKRPELTEPLTEQGLKFDDRLAFPQTAQEPLDIHESDDLLDPINYREADKYTELANTTSTQTKQRAIAKMKAVQRSQGGGPGVKGKENEDSIGLKDIFADPTSKIQPLASNIKYNPYPSGMGQTTIDPTSGRYDTRKKTKSHRATAELARNNDLTISRLAKRAREDINQAFSEDKSNSKST